MGAITNIRVTGVDCAWVSVVALENEVYAGTSSGLAYVLSAGLCIVTVYISVGTVPSHRRAAVESTGISVHAGFVYVRAEPGLFITVVGGAFIIVITVGHR